VILRCRSIHTFGMHAPIGVVALDASGKVIGTVVVPPRRVVGIRRARWIIEVPAGRLPAVGEPALLRRAGAAGE
jgi:hypothetical protein